MSIPRIIHQTARTEEIPPTWRRYQSRIKELHPEWEYHFWTDEDNARFVSEEFPDLLASFQAMTFGIMRADVIRYLLLFKFGGLYVDLDYEFFKAFDLTTEDCVLPLETERDEPVRVGNAVMASAPGQLFMGTVIDRLRRTVPQASSEQEVLEATGPLFLTGILNGLAPEEAATVCLPQRQLFSPQTPRNARQYRALVKQGNSYGVHHCHGSWRTFSRFEQVKQRVGRLAP